MTDKTTSGIFGAAAVSVLAILSIGLVLYVNHRDTDRQRREFRAAVTLIARANCKELAIFRATSLARAKGDGIQHAAILAFYRRLEAPINDALDKLGKPPCQP